ncbi:uncharacterized protein DUF560 [Yoonia maricola]|uniref:Uncharacterized protein DUF560 n=1 Tax=Yoonia maricola TaxID=420999 RepID=A0A2M8WJU3_9RHOB|nr:surface lipoprotein assembly modifier [Yoonia maricola]PJI91194.1 uncharacterized protein DUF560 [Yoonia maricola]
MRRFQVVAVIFALCAAPAVAQDQVEVPLAQAGDLAAQALIAGEVALALQIAEAVLAQRPDDRTALIVVAAAAPRLGDPAKGRSAGARAWAVSQGDAQKYEAARLTALAAAGEERFTLSAFWLRLALTVAPGEAERAQTLRDGRTISRRNPWSTQLSFSLVPSNNVNGGAENDDCASVGSFDCSLSEDSVALSGWRASLGFSTQYRLQEAQRSRTTVGLQYQTSRVRITEDTLVPDASLKTEFTQFNLRHDRILENGTISGHYSFGRYNYNSIVDLEDGTLSSESYDIWRVGVDRNLPLTETLNLSLGLQREWFTYSVSGIGEVDRLAFSTGLSYALANDDRVTASLVLKDSEGENASYTFTEQSISLGYRWSDPVGPVSLSVGGGIRLADYPIFVTSSDGREDRVVFANANIGFPNVSFAGFTPGLRIDASKSDSNVTRFDRNTFSAGLTISSQF